MIVTKYQLADAQREAAQDRAHEMCISKIQQLDEQNKRLLDEKIDCSQKLVELYGEVQQIVIDNVETTEQNKQLTNELASAMTQIKVANEDFNEERLSLRARIAELERTLKDWEDEEFI